MEAFRVTWDQENGCDPCCAKVQSVFDRYGLEFAEDMTTVFLAPAEAVFNCPHGASESAPGVLVKLPDLPL